MVCMLTKSPGQDPGLTSIPILWSIAMSNNNSELPVLVSGGGIGGLAAALALVRQGFQVQVFEQAPEIGEIGAGIQLGPNAFHAFDALGVELHRFVLTGLHAWAVYRIEN